MRSRADNPDYRLEIFSEEAEEEKEEEEEEEELEIQQYLQEQEERLRQKMELKAENRQLRELAMLEQMTLECEICQRTHTCNICPHIPDQYKALPTDKLRAYIREYFKDHTLSEEVRIKWGL